MEFNIFHFLVQFVSNCVLFSNVSSNTFWSIVKKSYKLIIHCKSNFVKVYLGIVAGIAINQMHNDSYKKKQGIQE
jgi:hypothetical protein